MASLRKTPLRWANSVIPPGILFTALMMAGCGSDAGVRPKADGVAEPPKRPPQELAAEALDNAKSTEARRVAVRQLNAQAVGVRSESYTEIDKSRLQRARLATVAKGTADISSVEKMRFVMAQSDDPVVLAEVVRGIGHVRDVESLPMILDLMDHPDEKVREATFYAAERLIGVRPVSKKNRATFYRDFYKHMQQRD